MISDNLLRSDVKLMKTSSGMAGNFEPSSGHAEIGGAASDDKTMPSKDFVNGFFR